MIKKSVMPCLATLCVFYLPFSQAEVNYQFNGFGTLAAGKILSGSVAEPEYLNYNCPCFITDYNNGGIYQSDKGWSFKEESRLGVQFNLNFTDDLSFVTQVIARAVDSKLSAEWAYLSYDVNDQITVQVGRKRIPLYYYSEFQDVGFAYMWLRPPQTLYGWEASNYNGVNVRFANEFKNWDIVTNVYAGNETVKNAPYNYLYDEVGQDSRWRNIRGIDIEFSKDWFTGRIIYMKSDNSSTERPDSDAFYRPATAQTVAGLSLNGDFGDWFVLSEFNMNKRVSRAEDYVIHAPATMLAMGYRFGKWTPFVSWSRFWDKSNNLEAYEPERFIDRSVTLRYELSSSSVLKFQLNKYTDHSLYNFVGNTTVAAVSYDFIF